MKKITSVFTLFLSLWCFQLLNAQIIVEYSPNGLPLTDDKFANYKPSGPFPPMDYYSYFQSIYLASELNASGSITSLSWHYNGGDGSGGNLPNSQDLVIYLGKTTKSSFASTTEWIPVANMTKVYQGGITVYPVDGWYRVDLQTPFPYDGNSNLVVAVNEKHSGFDSSSFFYNSPMTTNRTLGFYGNTTISPTSPSAKYAETMAKLPNVMFSGLTKRCPQPESLSFSNVTTSSAKIMWDNSAAGTGASFEYYYTKSSTTPDGTTVPLGNVADNNALLNNPPMDGNTTYYTWLRSVCSDQTKSSWTGPIVFTTECDATSLINENFDNLTNTQIPTCWNRILRGPTSAKTSIGAISNSFIDGKAIVLKNDGSDLTKNDLIFALPKLNTLASGKYRLRFNARTSPYDPQIGSIKVGTLNGVNSNAVFTKKEDITLKDTDQEYIIDFTNYLTTDTYIGIQMTTPGDFGNVYIDKVVWEVVPSCQDISNLQVPETTSNSAKVTWHSENDTFFQLALGTPQDEDPSKLNPISVGLGTNFYDLDNTKISPATSYRVWVRSACEGNLYGNWQGPVSFSTPCEGTADVLIEKFDDNTISVPGLPSCWTKILRGPTNSNTSDIVTVSDSGIIKNAKSGTNAIKINNAVGTGSNDIILVTKAITNLYDIDKQLVFYAKKGSSNSTRLQVGTLKSNAVDASIYVLSWNEFELTDYYKKYVVDLSVSPGTDKYLGFRVNSATNSVIYLDDITFDLKINEPEDDPVLGYSDNTLKGFKSYPNPVKDVLNIESKDVIDAISIYNILGQEVINKKFNTLNASIEMNSLDKGIYMVKVLSNEKTNVLRVLKE